MTAVCVCRPTPVSTGGGRTATAGSTTGRYAVIYFGTSGDARKAVDESRHLAAGSALHGIEATLLLSDEEVVEDK